MVRSPRLTATSTIFRIPAARPRVVAHSPLQLIRATAVTRRKWALRRSTACESPCTRSMTSPCFTSRCHRWSSTRCARQGLAEWKTVLFTDHPGSNASHRGSSRSAASGPRSRGRGRLVVVPVLVRRRPAAARRALSRVLRRRIQRADCPNCGLCLGKIPRRRCRSACRPRAVTHGEFDSCSQSGTLIFSCSTRAVLYIDHGDVLTSAGTRLGLAARLHSCGHASVRMPRIRSPAASSSPRTGRAARRSTSNTQFRRAPQTTRWRTCWSGLWVAWVSPSASIVSPPRRT